jgi:hypothetical protein
VAIARKTRGRNEKACDSGILKENFEKCIVVAKRGTGH